MMKGEDGEIVFTDTGDPLIDKWEAELAAGLMPDLTEGMPEKEKMKLKEAKNNPKKISGLVDVSTVDPRYASKVVGKGSKEEASLNKKHYLNESEMRKMLLGKG